MPERTAVTRSITEIAPDVLVVDAGFVDPPQLTWRAGQFISLRCPLAGDPNARRSYSIASSPVQVDHLELLIKLVPNGTGSELFRTLKPGDPLHFTGPMGFFTVDLVQPADAVFAATGTGIAAALPMIEELLARPGETGRVWFLWGMRHESELYWLDRIAACAKSPRFEHRICLSRGSEGWTGARGYVTTHALELLPTLAAPVFYLVGNGAMVRDLKKALVDHPAGVDRKKQVRTEVFYPVAAK